MNKSSLQQDKNGSCCQHRLNRWHDFSHRRAAAEDGLYLSDHLASVGRGSNHDAHDADISLASRKVSSLLEDASLSVSPVLSTRDVRVMITSVATTCLLFWQNTERLNLGMDERLRDLCKHGTRVDTNGIPVLKTRDTRSTKRRDTSETLYLTSFPARYLIQATISG